MVRNEAGSKLRKVLNEFLKDTLNQQSNKINSSKRI